MSLVSASRRAFLRRSISRSVMMPPPWVVQDFTDHCSRCDDCIKACPEQILIRGDGGFPEIDFSRGGCEFCGDCARACSEPVFDLNQGSAWSLKAFIRDNCLAGLGIICRSCVDPCAEKAIVFQTTVGGRALPFIHQELCNGCGFCYAVCPQQAIEIKETT